MESSTGANHQFPETSRQFRGAAGITSAGRLPSSRADSAAALPDAATSLLVREREKGKSSERNTLPEPWEYYRDEWPRKRIIEKIFPRFVPERVEQEYNVYKHDHGAFLDSLRTAIMMRLVGLFSFFFFRYISLLHSSAQGVSQFWPGVAGQFFIINLMISLVYLGAAHWILRACQCFQNYVEVGSVIFIMHHVFYTLLDSQRAAVLIHFFTGWQDTVHGPALYDDGVATLVALFGLTSASLCGHLGVFKVFVLLSYTIFLYFLYIILLSDEPYQTWWEYVLLHVTGLTLMSLVLFLALRRCDIGWRHRFIQGRTVRSELAHHRKAKPFYNAQRRLLSAVFYTVFVVGGESFEIVDDDNRKLDEFFGGKMNMLGMNLLSLFGADEADGESWARAPPSRRESEYERFYSYMRLLGSEETNCVEPAKLIHLRFCYATEDSRRRCLDVEMFGVKFEAPGETGFGMADSNGRPTSLFEEENSLASERYILALRKATTSTEKMKSMDKFSRNISLEESFSLGGAEADWIDSALCCRLKDRVDELKGLIREMQSQEGIIDHQGARGLHEDGMDSGRRAVEEALKDVEMITNRQGSRIVTPRMVSSAEKRVTELRFDGVEEMQASQDCKILFGVPTDKIGESVGLNLQRNFKFLQKMHLETIRDDEEAEVGDWV